MSEIPKKRRKITKRKSKKLGKKKLTKACHTCVFLVKEQDGTYRKQEFTKIMTCTDRNMSKVGQQAIKQSERFEQEKIQKIKKQATKNLQQLQKTRRQAIDSFEEVKKINQEYIFWQNLQPIQGLINWPCY